MIKRWHGKPGSRFGGDMANDSYDNFFAKAKDNKRSDEPVDRVRFSVKPQYSVKPAKPQPKPSSKMQDERLRRALKVRRKKTPFPWKAVAGLGASLILAGLYVAAPDAFEKVLDKVEVSAMGVAGAEEKPAEKSKATIAAEKAAAEKDSEARGKSLDDKGAVQEDVNHFDKLKQRKEELDAREKELNELEEELQKQKVELDKRITQLEEMRNNIAQTLKDRVEVDQEKVNKLVDLYSNMKPKQAADILGSLNEELAVEVLAKMKKKNAAEIMNLLPAEKARVLSEKYTGYRRISSVEKGQ
jgi:flagellar motility protein MotE (MotC chaperone)